MLNQLVCVMFLSYLHRLPPRFWRHKVWKTFHTVVDAKIELNLHFSLQWICTISRRTYHPIEYTLQFTHVYGVTYMSIWHNCGWMASKNFRPVLKHIPSRYYNIASDVCGYFGTTIYKLPLDAVCLSLSHKCNAC